MIALKEQYCSAVWLLVFLGYFDSCSLYCFQCVFTVSSWRWNQASQKENPEGVQLRKAPSVLLNLRYPLLLLMAAYSGIAVSSQLVDLSLSEMVPRPEKVQNPLSCASRVRPAGVSKLRAGGRDRMGQERCNATLGPGARGYTGVCLAGQRCACKDRAVNAAGWERLSPLPRPSPVLEASGAEQRATTLWLGDPASCFSFIIQSFVLLGMVFV